MQLPGFHISDVLGQGGGVVASHEACEPRVLH